MNIIDLVSKNNGWDMAFAGITIVFTSLVILAFTISRIHILLDAWEERKALKEKFLASFRGEKKEPVQTDETIPAPLKESAKRFKVFSSIIGEPFKLPELIRFAEKRGMTTPCPKLTIDALIKAKLIVNEEDNLFCWDNSLCDSFM